MRDERVQPFFDRYQQALLARDADLVAELYSVPSLIVFPGNLIAVTDAGQTREFFSSAWSQYEGVGEVERESSVMAEAPGTVWVDVTWLFQHRPSERFCYQLVEASDGYRISVLTPLEAIGR